MKAIFETSVYLIIMTIICLFSVDFVAMNVGVSKVSHTEQYIEEYIEVSAKNAPGNTIDETTVNAVKEYVSSAGLEFDYEYVTSTSTYKYYKVKLIYSLNSRIFNLGKKHSFDGMVRVAITGNET